MLRYLYRRVILFIVRVLTLTYVRRYEVVGREHVPHDGGLIVVSNHLNNADPPMVARALGRDPIFMAKKEMVELPVAGWLFRAWGAFPVRRGEADLGALRKATEIVRSGEALMMFPEGTRSRTGGLTQAHPGTAMIALKTDAPVLPVAVTGTEQIKWPSFFLRPRSVPVVRVTIGAPFRPAHPARINSASTRAATDEIMAHVAALLPERYRGVYGDADATASEPALSETV